MDKQLEFEGRSIERRYTKEWFDSGLIRKDMIPELVQSLVSQQKKMVEYIEALHNKIDWILETNNCCDMPDCFTANCTSDHK